MKIKTVWEYSPETEALRIAFNAHQIATGFYRINNFFVLPLDYKLQSGVASKVATPYLPYRSIPRFWERAKKSVFSTVPIVADKKLVEGIKNLLKDNPIPVPKYGSAKLTWDKASKEIFTEILKIMPKKQDSLKKIIIYPTVAGTTCSFSYIANKEKSMYIYLRDDQDIVAITEAVLTYLTRLDVYEDLGGQWSESELLVDWLITKSSLSKVLKKYSPNSSFVPTLKATRVKQTAQILKDSDKFYNKLGVPTNNKVFDLNGENLLINRRPAENLTLTEKLLLKLLIEKANNVASFDDLGEILFKSEDDFSLYAISKQIERLRNKLEENGVSSSYIQTLRGQGYILKN